MSLLGSFYKSLKNIPSKKPQRAASPEEALSLFTNHYNLLQN